MPDLHPWRVLRSETLIDHAPWLKVIRQTVQLPNGAIMDDYFLAPGRDYGLVVAVTDDERVLLVRQYKHGLGRVVYDFPAGYLDSPDEDPLACAQRELREETGYTAREWRPLGVWGIDSNRSPNVAHLFLARGLTRVSDPVLDHSEDLQHVAVPITEVNQWLRAGELPTLACAAAWGLAMSAMNERDG